MERRKARKGDDVFFSSPFPTTYHSPAVRVMKTSDNGLVDYSQMKSKCGKNKQEPRVCH